MAGSQDFAADPRNADLLIYVNGDLVPRAEAKVSIFDAGFVLGDGVWEGLRLHKGRLLFLETHLDRLYEGLARIELDIGLAREALTAEIQTTTKLAESLAAALPILKEASDKSALVVAYCGGPTCGAYAAAAKAAQELGYTNIKHLSAGISGWKAANAPLEAAK